MKENQTEAGPGILLEWLKSAAELCLKSLLTGSEETLADHSSPRNDVFQLCETAKLSECKLQTHFSPSAVSRKYGRGTHCNIIGCSLTFSVLTHISSPELSLTCPNTTAVLKMLLFLLHAGIFLHYLHTLCLITCLRFCLAERRRQAC